MPEVDLHETLMRVRDCGLREPSWDGIDARCRAALAREIDRESGRPRPARGVVGVRPRLHRQARRAVVIALSVVVVGGLGAAGYAVLAGSSTASDGIECHMDGKLDGSGTMTHLDGRRATQTCADLWARGDVGDGAHAAPAPLHACVDPHGGGAIHVFATNDHAICNRVGLREDPTAGADPTAARYGHFAAFLSRRLNQRAFDCPTVPRLRRLIRDAFRASGLTGWTIAGTGGGSARPGCASLAIDSTARAITISVTTR